MLPNVFSISYFVIIDDSESYSPFCGFGNNLLNSRKEILKILKLPKNIVELGKNTKNRFDHRLNVNTSHLIFPIMYTSFCITEYELPCLFPVVIYDKSRFPNITNKVQKLNNTPLLIELNQQITDQDFIDFFKEKIISFQEMHKDEISKDFINNVYNDIEPQSENEIIYKKIKIHGTVDFLIKVLEDNGIVFQNQSVFNASIDQESYYKNIWSINYIIQNLLNKKKKRHFNSVDCIFTSAPLYTRYLLRKSFNKLPNTDIQKVFKIIIGQIDYTLHTIPENTNFLLPALAIREEEILLYYICLYLIFEKYFCPVIRLPQGIQSDMQAEIDALYNSLEDKKSKAFNNLIYKQEYYFKEYTSFINTYKRIPTIKIYSDAPIEFVRDNKNKLPILISTSLCKIPATPGNIFFNSCSNDLDMFIYYEELFEILIIRSFADTDPIKYDLENNIKKFFKKSGIQHIHYIIIDVFDNDSVINALKQYSNIKIVIFDCHGQQSKNDIYGGLKIGNGIFNIWEIIKNKEFFSLPPIVMFSTCNTFPIGNNFNSIANGFLAAGVKTVIATNSPINSFESGVFIARILYRIDELLPKLIKIKKIFTWLSFISDFFRMSYTTDIIKYFVDNGYITYYDWYQIGLYENCSINSKDTEWFQNFLSSLSNKSGKSIKECNDIINSIGMTETMKYIVLGNADSIFIHYD